MTHALRLTTEYDRGSMWRARPTQYEFAEKPYVRTEDGIEKGK